MELTKRDTKMIQGLSVLAMLCLHLFDRDYSGLFTPVVFIGGVPLSFYFAQLSDFCVMGFAFCSGYAHMTQTGKEDYYRNRIKKLFILVVQYWIVLTAFCILSIAIGNGELIPRNMSTFLLHVLMLDKSYNGAWWYLQTYCILIIISPITLRFVEKNPKLSLFVSFAIYCVAFYFRFYSDITLWSLSIFGTFGMTVFEYILGAFFCHLKLFSKGSIIVDNYIGKKFQPVCSLLLLLTLAFFHTKIVSNVFIAPFTGFIIIFCFHLWNKPKAIMTFMGFIGKHSTNIWLTHMFFFSTLFVDMVYVAKYPSMIYLFLLAITIGCSYVLKMLQNPITSYLDKRILI